MDKKILIYTKLLFYNLLIFTLKEIPNMIKLKIGDHEAQEFSDEQIDDFKNVAGGCSYCVSSSIATR